MSKQLCLCFIFNFPLSLWSQVNFLFLEGGTDREGGIGARVGCRFHIPPWLSSSIVMLELLSYVMVKHRKQVFLLLPLNGLLLSCWPFNYYQRVREKMRIWLLQSLGIFGEQSTDKYGACCNLIFHGCFTRRNIRIVIWLKCVDVLLPQRRIFIYLFLNVFLFIIEVFNLSPGSHIIMLYKLGLRQLTWINFFCCLFHSGIDLFVDSIQKKLMFSKTFAFSLAVSSTHLWDSHNVRDVACSWLDT